MDGSRSRRRPGSRPSLCPPRGSSTSTSPASCVNSEQKSEGEGGTYAAPAEPDGADFFRIFAHVPDALLDQRPDDRFAVLGEPRPERGGHLGRAGRLVEQRRFGVRLERGDVLADCKRVVEVSGKSEERRRGERRTGDGNDVVLEVVGAGASRQSCAVYGLSRGPTRRRSTPSQRLRAQKDQIRAVASCMAQVSELTFVREEPNVRDVPTAMSSPAHQHPSRLQGRRGEAGRAQDVGDEDERLLLAAVLGRGDVDVEIAELGRAALGRAATGRSDTDERRAGR